MDLELSDDQVALRDEVRRFLAERLDSAALRRCIEMPGAVDHDLWKELGHMGVFGLTVQEAQGGVGLGLAEAAIVFEELGRAAVPGPLVASFLAASCVEGAARGEVIVGAVEEAQPAVVENIDGLDLLLVLRPDGVRKTEPPHGRRLARPLDPLTPVHHVAELPMGEQLGGAEVSARLHQEAGLLIAALQVGLGQAAVSLATEYAKQRAQFGRPIGGFQAVKHMLADAHVWVDVARAAVHAAAVALDEGEGADAIETCGVSSARMVASRAAARATSTCVQVHGGMGYTWEVDAHLYLKRVAVLDVAFGTNGAALEQRAASLVSR